MASGAGEKMINLKKYGDSCDYIRTTFGLTKGESIYEIVNVITDAYKNLEDKLKMANAKTEESVKCQTRTRTKK